MKTKLLTCGLLLASFALTAQNNEKKQATVHIKKVENINGVEKVTDTTYTTDNPNIIVSGDKHMQVKTEDIKNENGTVIKTIVIDDQNGSGDKVTVKDNVVILDKNGKEMRSDKSVQILTSDKMTDAEMQKAMEEAQKAMKEAQKEMKLSQKEMQLSQEAMKEAEKAMKEADKNGKARQVIIINSEENNDNGKSERRMTKTVILKMDVTDASPGDVKRLKSQLGTVDNKVEMESMRLYPNPNDGKFNLNFNLKNKGDAEVTVYNAEGKQVYNEKLPDFQGEYNKPIDISNNAKGVYFVKIQQGSHTQAKKISLD